MIWIHDRNNYYYVLIIIIIQRFIQVLATGIARAALTCNEYVPRAEHNVISHTRTSPGGGQKGERECHPMVAFSK